MKTTYSRTHPIAAPLVRGAATATALLILCACQNVPKYKKSSGKFDEWSEYEGRGFSPSSGIVTAVDIPAGTITIGAGTKQEIFTVLPTTRIIHQGTDITLAELPPHQVVKYTVSADRKRLLSVWYGEHSDAIHHNVQAKAKNSFL